MWEREKEKREESASWRLTKDRGIADQEKPQPGWIIVDNLLLASHIFCVIPCLYKISEQGHNWIAKKLLHYLATGS